MSITRLFLTTDHRLLNLVARSGLAFHFAGGVLDRIHYMLVAGATAQVSFKPVSYIIVAWIEIAVEC